MPSLSLEMKTLCIPVSLLPSYGTYPNWNQSLKQNEETESRISTSEVAVAWGCDFKQTFKESLWRNGPVNRLKDEEGPALRILVVAESHTELGTMKTIIPKRD